MDLSTKTDKQLQSILKRAERSVSRAESKLHALLNNPRACHRMERIEEERADMHSSKMDVINVILTIEFNKGHK